MSKDYYEYHESKESLMTDHCAFCGTEDNSWHECVRCKKHLKADVCNDNGGMCDECLGKE